MKIVSTLAIAATLAVGAAASAPAFAQASQAQAPAAPAAPARKLNLSKAERAALAPLQQAVTAKDFAKAATLLPAAQAAAQSDDAKYFVATFQLQLAIESKDQSAQAAAIEAMIASGGATQAELPRLYSGLGALYTGLKQSDRAAAAYRKLGELDPNNVTAILATAEATAPTDKAQAVTLIERAIAAQKASGQAVPENWYRRALKFAYEGKLAPQTAKISRDLVTAYPNATNWRDVLSIYRESTTLDRQGETELLRLMRATKTLKGDTEYYALARNLNDMGLPGESKAVIDEGVQARQISPTKDYFRQLLASTGGRVSADRAALPALQSKAMSGSSGKLALNTGDAFYGYGDYSQAAALYRAALQKGGVDKDLVNTRLGAALALAGQRAEAEAAFRAVSGSHANLASFWLLWLSQRG